MNGKILFLEWKSFGNEFAIETFQKLGFEVVRMDFPRDTEDARLGTELAEKVLNKIIEVAPVFVFSFNYFPVAAIACKATSVKYVSWVYDSPFVMLYSQTVLYDTNRVFVFDSSEACRLQSLGAKNVFYLPMGSAVGYYDTCIPNLQQHQKFDSDVSFIGSMYSEKQHQFFRHLDKVDDYTKGFVEALMEAQKNIYGMDILESTLLQSPEIVKNMQNACPLEASGDGLETVEWTFANYFLARKVTAMERRQIMEKLSQNAIDKEWVVRLFTPEVSNQFKGVINGGEVNYVNEAPYAMKCAKINLNISLKSIHSGMPLRALDIMGCGGFLLTNYQSDFMEYFVLGEDFVYYENINEVPFLVEYYLEHEEERLQIAQNGYKKVKENLSYETQIKKMLDYL